MKKLIEKSIKKYFQLRQFRAMLLRNNQQATQELLLVELLSSAEETVFGKEHSFSDIFSLEEYQKNVPVRKYEEMHPYITRMLEGEAGVLWPGKIKNFSKSSGTTNNVSKYLPVSRESLQENHYKAGKDIYTFYFMNHPESTLFENFGAALCISGSFDPSFEKIRVGDISAILSRELPPWAQKRREPSLKTSLISSWKKKIPRLISESVEKNITHLSGVPTWFVSIFDELQKTHPYTDLREVWPNLELFIHGAVCFDPYRPLFEKLFPKGDINYLEVYNASEGFFALQDDMTKPGEMLLLTDHGIFYEFIPMNEYGSNTAQAYPLQEVKCGVHYAMIITTNAGLWRYDIGDTVMFTSLEPYRIKVTGRTKHFINICGEELMVGNTDQAIARATEATGSLVEHYTVAPIFMNAEGKAGHEWLIEFKEEPEDASLFARILDMELQEINSDYKAKRQDDIALQELALNIVPQGSFLKWMEQRGKLGGQHKVPRLSNNRTILDEIKSLSL